MPMALCSVSTVSQSQPPRASSRAASTLPSVSQVPTAGFPSFSKRLIRLERMLYGLETSQWERESRCRQCKPGNCGEQGNPAASLSDSGIDAALDWAGQAAGGGWRKLGDVRCGADGWGCRGRGDSCSTC